MPKTRKEPQQQEEQKQQLPRQRKPPALASALSGAVSGAVISACVQVRLLGLLGPCRCARQHKPINGCCRCFTQSLRGSTGLSQPGCALTLQCRKHAAVMCLQ
jgi:hypothetical protein